MRKSINAKPYQLIDALKVYVEYEDAITSEDWDLRDKLLIRLNERKWSDKSILDIICSSPPEINTEIKQKIRFNIIKQKYNLK